jgi:hypothetical protein
VLVAGGDPRPEVFDPKTKTWTDTGPLRTPHTSGEAVRIGQKVMLVGGYDESGADPTNISEIYDPATNTWTITGAMHLARAEFALAKLGDGRVLASGGFDAKNHAEAYDPATGTWSSVDDMAELRENQTATQLTDGSVLVTGGFSELANDNVPTTERFTF